MPGFFTSKAVKDTAQQVAIAISVPVAATATALAVAFFASDFDARWRQPLVLGPFAGNVAALWKDAVRPANEPRTFTSAMRRDTEAAAHEFVLPDTTILVSVLRAEGPFPCHALITFDGQTPRRWDRSLCPMRIAVTDRHTHAVAIVQGTACLPPYEDDIHSGTTAALDMRSGTVALNTIRSGRPEPACDRTLHLPTP